MHLYLGPNKGFLPKNIFLTRLVTLQLKKFVYLSKVQPSLYS